MNEELSRGDDPIAYWRDFGYRRGRSIASFLFGELPTDPEQAIDYLYAAERNDRDFSPFEFIAKALNSELDPDTAWEAFESGLSRAFQEEVDSWKEPPSKGGKEEDDVL